MAKQQASTPTQQLNAQTMGFLGITQQPFTTSILSADAVYTDATRDQMIATLRHHMQFSDLVLIVEGEQGSGKTTLFRQIIQSGIPNLFLMSVLAEPTDTLVQLQQKMSAYLKNQGSPNYLDQDLKNLQVFDQTPIVIIDDAHVLSDTTLQELIRYRSQLKLDKDTNLKVLLFANPGMAKTLEDISDLQHNQLYVQQMPELNQKQTEAFIQHRLAKAGYTGVNVLPPETIEQIQKKSQGQPGKIMQLGALMLDKHVRNLGKQGAGRWMKMTAMIAIPVLVAGGGYYWLQHSPVNETTLAPTQDAQPVEQTAEPVPDEPFMAEPATEFPTISADDAPPSAETADTEAETAPVEAAEPALAEIPPEPSADISTSGIAPPTPSTDSVTAAPATSAPAPAATVTPPAAPVADKPVEAETTAKPQSATPVAASPPAPTIPDKEISELASLGLHDKTWLLNQNKTYWTIQLLAARDLTTLIKFARSHKLGDDSAWYETRLDGKPWYVLVSRLYTSAEAARKGLSLLPTGLQTGRPWIKSLASVQKDIAR